MTEDGETPEEDAERGEAGQGRDAGEDEPAPADASTEDGGPSSSSEPGSDVERAGRGDEPGRPAAGDEGDRSGAGEPSDGEAGGGGEPPLGTGSRGPGERGGGPGGRDDRRERDERAFDEREHEDRTVDERDGDDADPHGRTVDAAAAGRGVAAEIEAARPGEEEGEVASDAEGGEPGTEATGEAPGATGDGTGGAPRRAGESGDDVPEDVRSYDRFQKVDRASYDRVNEFLRERTYITAREWAIARLCADFRTATGVEMTKIGENLPHLVPFMTDTYSPQAVNQARSAFEEKVRMSGATFLYGAMSGFFTADELDDIMYEVTEVAKFLLEVEGVELAVEEELDSEDRISAVMREVRRASAELRHEGVECPECGHRLHGSGAEADAE